jgi:hypothetical protein
VEGWAVGSEKSLEQAITQQKDVQTLRWQVLRCRYWGYRRHLAKQLVKPKSLVTALGLGFGAGILLGSGSQPSVQNSQGKLEVLCRRLFFGLLIRQMGQVLRPAPVPADINQCNRDD